MAAEKIQSHTNTMQFKSWVSAGTKFTLAKNAKQGKISLAFSELL